MKQIDLDSHEHSHTIQITPLNKKLVLVIALVWLVFGIVMFGFNYEVWVFSIFSLFIGVFWVGAFPAYHLSKPID